MGVENVIERTDEILDRFDCLRIWSSGDRRAPHKPLLSLLAIGRCLQGYDRLATFDTLRGKLTDLLREFGPVRTVDHPEHPFWRMQGDRVWEVNRPDLVKLTSKGDALVSSLLFHSIQGGFPQSIHEEFRHNPDTAMNVASRLLHAHFPETYHGDILRATGITAPLPEKESGFVREAAPEYQISRRLKRPDGFRQAVLDAYESQCAVCEFALKIGDKPIALEAAHIKWHRASGPPEIRNGLSLCALHHNLFDKGTFTLLPKEHKVIVAESVADTDPGFEEALGKFHEKRLNFVPHNIEDIPAREFIEWHQREVFRSPSQIHQS